MRFNFDFSAFLPKILSFCWSKRMEKQVFCHVCIYFDHKHWTVVEWIYVMYILCMLILFFLFFFSTFLRSISTNDISIYIRSHKIQLMGVINEAIYHYKYLQIELRTHKFNAKVNFSRFRFDICLQIFLFFSKFVSYNWYIIFSVD